MCGDAVDRRSTGCSPAVAPIEISDPALRALQEQSFSDLKTVGQTIAGHSFTFPFYSAASSILKRRCRSDRISTPYALSTSMA